MIIESRKLEQIQLRHLPVKRGPANDCVVWWYGALRRNIRDKTLPLAVVWFRRLLPDGSLGQFIRIDVGITELALLQIGTIWNEGVCRSQLQLEEREFSVDFSSHGWRYESQARVNERSLGSLIPKNMYPLYHGLRDRSEVIIFSMRDRQELLVPALEFFSRCYGRSAEVNRVLSTYPWSEAEPRLHLPHSHAIPPKHWSVNLPAKIYNDDAPFVAHVKYDQHTRQVAKSIYSQLEVQFNSPNGLAFPQIAPWFIGAAKLLVQGIQLDDDRFLALRIVGGSEPKGPRIWSFRDENPGKAGEQAPDGAEKSSWPNGRDRLAGVIHPLVNITPTDPAGHDGNIVEVLNPSFRIIGARREVVPQRLPNAKTRPGPPIPNQNSDQHSSGERQGSGSATGVASIHAETQLESRGAARDVWEALLHLHDTIPELVESVGWYSPLADGINFTDREPGMVALLQLDEQLCGPPPLSGKWVYIDHAQTRVRGVLVAFVKTPTRSAYLFEIERRQGQRLADDGTPYAKEQAFCGLIVSPPTDMGPDDWIPEVLKGIRVEEGVMARVTQYCPGNLVDYYRRSSSKWDEIAGHSTVINALGKVNIQVPHPKEQIQPSKNVIAR